MNIVTRARKLAEVHFWNKIDDEGKSYILHLEQVAKLLSIVTQDEEIIAAGWLHDMIEDTDYTPQQLKEEFGQRVHDLVMEVTHEGTKDNHGYYFPRLETKDGITIKFADRLSNLSRMGSWPQERVDQYLRKSKFWKSEGPK